MKLLGLSLILLFSGLSIQAQACERNHDECFSVRWRFQFQQSVAALENPGQVNEVLSQLVSIAETHRFHPQSIINGYEAVAKSFGSSNTAQIKAALRRIAQHAQDSEDFVDLASFTVAVERRENSPTQSVEAVDLVGRHWHLENAGEAYLQALNGLGSPHTDHVRSAFRKMVDYSDAGDLLEMAKVLSRVERRENAPSQSVEGLVWILKGARVCGSIADAAYVYLELLSSIGSGNTAEVQKNYRTVMGL